MTDIEPRILAETPDFLVLFKPGGLHSAPLRDGESDTLLFWCGQRRPEVLSVQGRKAVERGLLHRLDRDTAGLVLLAKRQDAYDFLSEAQESGNFAKEYVAICEPAAEWVGRATPFEIESGFRPFGPGRRLVRAVPPGETPRGRELALDRGRPYRTEVLGVEACEHSQLRVKVRLLRGFRHQVRCHLAWVGLPIRGDELYGRPGGGLALTATALAFPDPAGAAFLRYGLDQFPPFSSWLSGE